MRKPDGAETKISKFANCKSRAASRRPDRGLSLEQRINDEACCLAFVAEQCRRTDQYVLAVDCQRALYGDQRARCWRMRRAETRAHQRIERLRHATAFHQPGMKARKAAIFGQLGNGLGELFGSLLSHLALAKRTHQPNPSALVGNRGTQRESLAQDRFALDADEA